MHCRSAAVPRWYVWYWFHGVSTWVNLLCCAGRQLCRLRNAPSAATTNGQQRHASGSPQLAATSAGYNNHHSHAAMPSSHCVMAVALQSFILWRKEVELCSRWQKHSRRAFANQAAVGSITYSIEHVQACADLVTTRLTCCFFTGSAAAHRRR